MNYLYRQVAYTSDSRKNMIIGFALLLFLSFVIIILTPFDTNNYEADHRLFLLSGFGLLLGLTYIIYSFIERRFYIVVDKIWLVWHEIVSMCIFFAVAGSIIYLYNRKIINELDYSVRSYLSYFAQIIILMIPLVSPFLVYLRQRLGSRTIITSPDTVVIQGENKEEILTLPKSHVVYVQAMENYVDIIYRDQSMTLKSKTFRQTLSKIQQEHRFLFKCHRSYLVNLEHVTHIDGNSQRAQLTLQDSDRKLPLSKSQYKSIKKAISDRKQ